MRKGGPKGGNGEDDSLARAKERMMPVRVSPAPEGTPPCGKCGSPMVRRTWRERSFLGCSAYPRCKETRKEVTPP